MGTLLLRFQQLRNGLEFKLGRTSLEDDPREGCPKSTSPEKVEQVHDMLLDDRRMKVREIAEIISI
jgi:hypothetical protein